MTGSPIPEFRLFKAGDHQESARFIFLCRQFIKCVKTDVSDPLKLNRLQGIFSVNVTILFDPAPGNFPPVFRFRDRGPPVRGFSVKDTAESLLITDFRHRISQPVLKPEFLSLKYVVV